MLGVSFENDIIRQRKKATPALLLVINTITAKNFRWHYAKKEYRSALKEKS
jgi:hypothetical protein